MAPQRTSCPYCGKLLLKKTVPQSLDGIIAKTLQLITCETCDAPSPPPRRRGTD